MCFKGCNVRMAKYSNDSKLNVSPLQIGFSHAMELVAGKGTGRNAGFNRPFFAFFK